MICLARELNFCTRMNSSSFPEWLPSSDRLRLLTEELRHVGAQKGILIALDILADELEQVEYAALEHRVPPGMEQYCGPHRNHLGITE
jgi:hypothetical protein